MKVRKPQAQRVAGLALLFLVIGLAILAPLSAGAETTKSNAVRPTSWIDDPDEPDNPN